VDSVTFEFVKEEKTKVLKATCAAVMVEICRRQLRGSPLQPRKCIRYHGSKLSSRSDLGILSKLPSDP
jgi:hypothetical protein